MKRKRLSVIDTFQLESPFATEFRRLLHKLLTAREEPPLKSLMVSSAMLSEGKSTVCSFLGITAALHKGMKTLVIDCDLRRPSIHKAFAMERDRGLAEILEEAFSPRDAVRKTSIDKLDLITCGRYNDTPTALFDAEAIGTLVEEMKFYYDLVLLDAAPALPVSDPMLLAPKVDGIVMVIKAGVTQKEVTERAVNILDPNRNRILGVVLNNMDNALPHYYDYRYYGYEYGHRTIKEKAAARSRGKRGRDEGKKGKGDPDPLKGAQTSRN